MGIIMFIILYLLYKFLLGKPVAKITNLRYDGKITPFSYSALTVPNSTRYCYYIWVHAKVIDSTTENIFQVNDLKYINNSKLFSLDIVNNTNLQVSVLTTPNTNAIGPYTLNNFLITPNFPIQSWQQIIVSFDNMYMDLYLNGKFVKSVQFNNATGINTLGIPVQTSSSTNIVFGEMGDNKSSPDIDVRLFERYEYSMDPQTAWNKYKSDKNVSDGTSTNYGLKFNLFTNNKLQSYPIF
jgi:hypothetical protein